MPHETAAAELLTLMVIVKSLILLMGGVVTYFATKAYLRTEDRSLGLLAAGFALITLGALLGGMVHELIQAQLVTGVLIEGVFVLAGLTLIAFSLRVN